MSTATLENNDYFNDSVATFGDRLEAAREAKGLTTESLAKKLGVDADTLEAWENDVDMPRANRIPMLAGMLNVSIVWLISGESNGTTHVEDTYDRPRGINDAIGEIAQLKDMLQSAVTKIEELETRLRAAR